MKKEIVSVLGFWIIAVCCALFLNVYDQKQAKNLLAFQTARVFFDQIVIARSWNAMHGGVYVPVNEYTQPNIHLEDPLRDLTTVQNLSLTKINPAFMTRQISEISSESKTGVRFHITSLNPIRPENEALNWEKNWLQSFEQGEEERGEFLTIGSESFFRYMAPLFVKDNCLKCHAKQGYKKGDIRGGISVTLPHFSQDTSFTLIAIYGLAALFGAFFIVVGGNLLNRQRMISLENEEYYKALHNASFGGIILHDQMRILDCNKEMSDMTGFSKAELVGMNGFKLIAPGSLDQVTQNIENGYAQRYEVEGIRKDGSVYPMAIRGKNILYKGQEVRVAELRDISEIKQAEKETDKLATQLRQAQKMEVMGTLAGGIAHDFNNILSPILGYTEILLEDTSPEDMVTKKSLNNIYTSALRASELVGQILTFSRQENTEYKPIKIQPILKETINLIRATMPKNIELFHDIDYGCPAVNADATQIHQVMMNLMTNAYHAMADDGGELRVSLVQKQVDSPVDEMVPGVKGGGYACLTVKDMGIGIEPDMVDKIFDPFFTTKEKGKGTGMGLSVIHGIVENMNGYIKVKSDYGHGTEFTVYLPLDVRNFIEMPLFDKKEVFQGKEHILLVDDEEQILDMEKMVLERLGYTISTRTSPIEALKAFQVSPEKFDMVITDLSMPGMTGDILGLELLKIRPSIPIILCTGFSDRITHESSIQMGMQGVLMKPVVTKELAKAIRNALGK